MAKRSEEEWDQLYQQFQQSCLSQNSFCRQAHIGTKEFRSYRHRRADETTLPPFIAVKRDATALSSSSPSVTVTVGSLTLSLPLGHPATVSLIKALL